MTYPWVIFLLVSSIFFSDGLKASDNGPSADPPTEPRPTRRCLFTETTPATSSATSNSVGALHTTPWPSSAASVTDPLSAADPSAPDASSAPPVAVGIERTVTNRYSADADPELAALLRAYKLRGF